jgi:hypothetical protein
MTGVSGKLAGRFQAISKIFLERRESSEASDHGIMVGKQFSSIAKVANPLE